VSFLRVFRAILHSREGICEIIRSLFGGIGVSWMLWVAMECLFSTSPGLGLNSFAATAVNRHVPILGLGSHRSE
jgi:hypothetical protein